REFGLVRDLRTGERSIVQGGSNYILPQPGQVMEGHSHWDQNAMPSGAHGDLDYIARNRLRGHEIRAPESEGISRAVIRRSLLRDRLVVRGYQNGREVIRDTYDISSYRNGPPNAGGGGGTPALLRSQTFPNGSLGSRIAQGVRGAAPRFSNVP